MKTIAKILSIALVVLPLSASAISVNVGADVDVRATTGQGATTTVTTGASGSTQVETPSGVMVDVDRSGDGDVMVTVMHRDGENAAGQDHTKAQIEAVVKGHANVKTVDLDADGMVDVAYVHHGWLFGFIPVNVTSHTIVSAPSTGSAAVKVSLPWWSVLVSGLSKVKTEAQSSLSTDATIQANASVNASAEARARLVEKIVMWLDAAATAEASANVK